MSRALAPAKVGTSMTYSKRRIARAARTRHSARDSVPVVADRMFAVTSGTLPAIRAPAGRRLGASRPARGAALRVDAVRRGDYIIFTADELQRGLPVRFEDLEEVAAAAVPSEATPAASPTAAPIPEPVAFNAAIDPADGSVAEAAPLGDDFSALSAAMVAFKEPRAVEIINGRAAMIGFMAALSSELFDDRSLTRQVIHTRTFTLADGVVKTAAGPAAGVFLASLVVLVVLVASLAPQLRNAKENGLEEVPEDFFLFKAESEMVNGRAAMVGLASLFLVERVYTHGAAFL